MHYANQYQIGLCSLPSKTEVRMGSLPSPPTDFCFNKCSHKMNWTNFINVKQIKTQDFLGLSKLIFWIIEEYMQIKYVVGLTICLTKPFLNTSIEM